MDWVRSTSQREAWSWAREKATFSPREVRQGNAIDKIIVVRVEEEGGKEMKSIFSG